MSSLGRVFEIAVIAGMSGKPSASLVESTSVPDASVGHTLAGGGVPFITQLRKCCRIALTVCVCGTGLAGKIALPQLFPGHAGPIGGSPTPGRLVLNPPTPPPCVVLGM